MIIVETSGCVAGDLTVDGKSVSEMTPEEEMVVLERILSKIKESCSSGETALSSILHTLQYEDHECDEGSCDQCGDTICRTTWRIE